MREKILLLRSQGKSYEEICNELKIAKVTVWRNISPERSKSGRIKWQKTVNDRKSEAKEKLGNKCCVCGYSKSKRALDLHHKQESLKSEKLKQLKDWRKLTKEEFDAELKKCVLLCKNCHCEAHDGFIDVSAFP